MNYVTRIISNEGTAEPFIARIWLGIWQLAEIVLKTNLIVKKTSTPYYNFQIAYEPLLDALRTCRTANRNIQQMVAEHKQKVSRNDIVLYQPPGVSITECTNQDLRDNVASFFTNGVIAIKDNIQKILEQFPVNIGCLFQKQPGFEQGVLKLKSEGHHTLSDYLLQVRRAWSEDYINRRISLEHGGWVIPHFEYKIVSNKKVIAVEPQINNVPISDYSIKIMQRIISFTENVIVYALKCKLKPNTVIVEIPKSQRDPNCPKRFKLLQKNQKVQVWDIQYSKTDFP